ncbi:expressed unknown protein [Seminavis robusta]|uniref:Uncharacterized protein n=1 Tax=Seminavis robusta TaxID=568900 RepID=A0A9N8DWR7_9STRA|nr:expressed unknown protein [Seminavis robusta]|eukprot:Sro403_g135590.1 n/a (632) ;mRNA; r:10349-12244
MDGSAMDSKAVAQNGSGATGTDDDGEDSQQPVISIDCFNKDPEQDNDSTEMELCMKIRYRDALRQYPHKVNDIAESFPFQLPPTTNIDVRDQLFHVVCQAWKQGDGTQFKTVYDMLLWFCNDSSSDKKNAPSSSSVLGILLGHMVPVDARTGRVQLTQSQINLLCHDGIVALGKDDITLHKQKAIEENHPTKIVFIMFEKRMKELRQHQPTDSWMLPMKSSTGITQHLLAALISTRLLPFFTFQELFPILLTIYGMTLVKPGSYFDELHQHALLKRTAFGAYREHYDLRGELDTETDRYLLCSVRRVMHALSYQPSNNNKPRANTGTNSCSLGAANNIMGSTESSLGQPGNHSGQTLRPTTNSDTINRSTEPTDNLLETKRSSSRNHDNDESESGMDLVDRASLVYYCPWDHHLQIEHMVQTAAKPEKVAAEMERFIKYQCEGTLKSLHFPQVNGIKNSKQSQPSEIRENLLQTVFHSMKQGDGKALPKAYYDIFEWSCQLSSINNAPSKSSILAYLLASMVLVDSETGRVHLTQSQINQLFQACNDNNNKAVAMEVGNPKEAAGETNSTTTSSLSESSKASSSLCMSDRDGNNNEAVPMEVGNPKEAAGETNSTTTSSLSESSKASSSFA